MLVIPAGRFTMGTAAGEEERERLAEEFRGRSEPRREVSVGAFAMAAHEVTRGQYRWFVEATGRDADGCFVWSGGAFIHAPARSWRSPGFDLTDDHPAVCVSWQDARAYVEWLGVRTGRRYRLASEAEWEYAARAGTTTPFYTGASITQEQANFVADDKSVYYEQTVDVGSFRPNRFGLHDMHGNAWEWVEDCYNPTYIDAPTNGAAWTSGDCSRRVVRGGSWSNLPSGIRSAFRSKSTISTRYDNYGFRVARTE